MTSVVLDYARRERDHRGFVDDKGWAHAVAHTADALDSCAQHPVTNLEERIAILNVIAELATLSEPLAYSEDDRLAFPVHRVIQGNQVAYDDLHTWISQFDIETTASKESVIRWVNALSAQPLLSSELGAAQSSTVGGHLESTQEAQCLLSLWNFASG